MWNKWWIQFLSVTSSFRIYYFRDISKVSLTMDITHFVVVYFIMTSQTKHLKHYEAQLITYDVIVKTNDKVYDVRSLACKIQDLNGRVPGTWKWTILNMSYEGSLHLLLHSS